MYLKYKIAISGKAGSGKNLASELFKKLIKDTYGIPNCILVSFADPIKHMALKMFPLLLDKSLFGESKYRLGIVPNAFKNGKPLTIRQLLIDIGKNGKMYNENIWVDSFNYYFDCAIKMDKEFIGSYIVTDCRFTNELDSLKKKNFTIIRIKRDNYTKIDDSSETEQDLIDDNKFDFILDNNGTLDDLKLNIENILKQL